MGEIRLLNESDVGDAVFLSDAAGWNQIPADWRRLIALEPEGCFGIEVDGRLAATTTTVCFGRRLAWIGMVLTDPEHRRRGLARRLMERALRYLEAREIDWIKLDATRMGQPLYERLGFVAEGSVERWAMEVPAGERRKPRAGFAVDPVLDFEAFGADRGAILAHLGLGEALAMDGGYAIGRPGARASSFGPCVARSPAVAWRLAEWFLERHPGDTVYWDLLPNNDAAARLAAGLGFERRRELVRMARPGKPGASPFVFDDSLVYATAGFEYG